MDVDMVLPGFQASFNFFVAALVELSLLFIGISFLVGIINEFFPRDRLQRWLSGTHGRGYLVAALLGGITPFCSCSTIPIMVGMLRAGAAFGPVMTFLLTSPLVNPVILALFISLLGMRITCWYGAMAIGLAICSGVLLERLGFNRYLRADMLGIDTHATAAARPIERTGAMPCCPGPIRQSLDSLRPVAAGPNRSFSPENCATIPGTIAAAQTNRWLVIFRAAYDQFVALLPYILAGVAIGSLIYGFLPADLVVRLAGPDNPLAIPVAAVVGVPLYLRASTMIPIAAGLLAKGMGLGAIIALIIGGAGASLPEVAMLKGLFRAPLLAAFLMVVFVMAVAAGFTIGFLQTFF